MKPVKIVILVLLCAVIGLCSLRGPEDPATSERHKEIAWVGKCKDAVKDVLKDPDSAQFRNVYFHRGQAGIPVACGEVNSKNSLGGYTGFKRFISAGSADTVYSEENVSDFGNLWNKMCR